MKRIELPRRTVVGLALVGLLTSLPSVAAGRGNRAPADIGASLGGFARFWDGAKAVLGSFWATTPLPRKNGASLDPWGQPGATLPPAPTPTAASGTTGDGLDPLSHP